MVKISWKTGRAKLRQLNLDSDNPRIPDVGDSPSPRDLIAALVHYEDVLDLAKQIVSFGGLFPTDTLVIVEEGGEKIVVEGNRRLAALMLLDNPELAPEPFIKRFASQSEQISKDAISDVNIVTAPSRTAAAPIILSRHSGDSLKRWKPGQQAKYIRTLHSAGEPISELAKRIGLTETEIKKELKTDTMLRVARSLDLPEEIRNVVDDARQFPYSVLERLVEAPIFLKTLGVEYDADANLIGSVEPDEFKKGLRRVVTDISKGKIDTRALNKVKDVEKYLGTLKADAPNKRRKGKFTSDELIHGADVKSGARTQKVAKSKKSKTLTWAYLPPRGFQCTASNRRVEAVFKELRKLKVAIFPNASGVLLRVFFEQLLTHHLDKTKKMGAVVAAARASEPMNRQKQRPDYHPSMTEMMKYVMSDPTITAKIPTQAQRLINKMVDSKQAWFSLELMNFYVHNVFAKPNESDLHAMWDVLQPLMEQLMV